MFFSRRIMYTHRLRPKRCVATQKPPTSQTTPKPDQSTKSNICIELFPVFIPTDY